MSWFDGDAFGLASPLSPFSAQADGQLAVLVARTALLFFALRRTRMPGGFVLGALFLASLAARGFVLPSFLASAVAIWRGPPAPALPRWVAPLAGAGVLAVLALSFRHAPPPPSVPASPRAAIDYWRGRQNLYRAHAVALAWAKTESPPGEAYASLAEIDWDLGDREKAEKIEKKLPPDRAAELERRWQK